MIIIGGGDTAADCLGTANRQGARSVTVLDHNPRPEPRAGLVNPSWPSAPSSRGSSPAHDEGVHEAWAREVVEFLGDESGAVRAVVVEEVEIVRVEGRREFRPIGERTELPADLVLLAAGFVGTDVPDLLDALGVEQDAARGTAVVDDRWQTVGAGRVLLRRRDARRLARRVGDRRGPRLRSRRRPRAQRRLGSAPARWSRARCRSEHATPNRRCADTGERPRPRSCRPPP